MRSNLWGALGKGAEYRSWSVRGEGEEREKPGGDMDEGSHRATGVEYASPECPDRS